MLKSHKKESSEKDIIYYRASVRNLEKRITEFKTSEDKLKKENESYKRQVMFYKDKLKIELSAKKIENNIFNFTNLNTPNPRRIYSNTKCLDKVNESGNAVDLNKMSQKDNYFSIMTLTDDNMNNNEVLHSLQNENIESDLADKNFDKINASKIIKVTCISSEKVKDYSDMKTINFEDCNDKKSKKHKLSPFKKPEKRRNISMMEFHAKKEKSVNNRKNIKGSSPMSQSIKPTFNKNNMKNQRTKSYNIKSVKQKIDKFNEKNIQTCNIIDKKISTQDENDSI
jgi:hypothetical protein